MNEVDSSTEGGHKKKGNDAVWRQSLRPKHNAAAARYS